MSLDQICIDLYNLFKDQFVWYEFDPHEFI